MKETTKEDQHSQRRSTKSNPRQKLNKQTNKCLELYREILRISETFVEISLRNLLEHLPEIWAFAVIFVETRAKMQAREAELPVHNF
jgi:hypothetical protein